MYHDLKPFYWWKRMKTTLVLGTQLNFSIAFHLLRDGQSKQVIQMLEDMLRSCIIEFEGGWERYLPLVEFTYNNSYQSNIQIASYEAMYENVEPSCVGQNWVKTN